MSSRAARLPPLQSIRNCVTLAALPFRAASRLRKLNSRTSHAGRFDGPCIAGTIEIFGGFGVALQSSGSSGQIETSDVVRTKPVPGKIVGLARLEEIYCLVVALYPLLRARQAGQRLHEERSSGKRSGAAMDMGDSL